MNSYLGKKEGNYEKLKSNESKIEREANMIQKLNKLKMEFNIKMVQNNEVVSPEIKLIGNSLNDYTNQLLNHYKSRYFNIKDENKKKKFLRDLKILIGIYGRFENIFQNMYKSNKVLTKKSVPKNTKGKQTPLPPKASQATRGDERGNVIQNRHINNVEENLPNRGTQCYKNSTLHLLLSIIKNELNTDENKNVLFDNLFINNQNGTKMNFKNLLKDMLLGKRIEYNKLINTFFPRTMQPNRHEYYHDNNEYLNGILQSGIFSERLLNKIFNINRETIIHANIQDYQVNSTINSYLIRHILQNIHAYVSSFPKNNNNTLDYIILQIAEEELVKPTYKQNKVITEPIYGLRHNINMNLNSNIIVNEYIYQISDISYYASQHYISVNKRGANFYYFNDLNRNTPRLLTRTETSNGQIDGFLPKTILLRKVNKKIFF